MLLVLNAALGAQLASPTTALAASAPADWPMYLHDGGLSAASAETILTPAAAPNLRPVWTYKTGGLISASATVVGGVAYVGSWDGYEYALNAATGALIWRTFLGITTAPTCAPPQIGVASVAAVVNGVVYVGGGDSNWYALNASTGGVLWTVPTGDNSATGGHYNWASPLIVGNSAYIGIASLGDCPLVQGQLLRVDLTTHLVVASVSFVPNGQVGGGIWTTPAIDTATNTVYVTTGTLNNVVQTTSESMVAVDATTLAIKSSWQIPRSAANADSDWGTSPILLTDSHGRALVAGINKNGFLYAFDRSNVALGPIWSDQVAVGGICPTCGDASVSSMAFAQGLLFAAGGNTTIGGIGYAGAVRAIDPATGNVVWAHGLADPVIPALAYDNGMVFAGSGPRLEVFDAASGARLASYSTGAGTYSPPTISNGVVYMGALNGTLYAFAPVTPGIVPIDANCPSGFVCQDIGAPTPAGGETVSAGSWAVSAGGAGIGLGSGIDQFRFMSQAVNGDLGITARIVAQSVVSAGTQSGLMVRQANDAGSPFYALTYAGGTSFQVQYRKAFGGATTSIKVAAPALPRYLQIQRVGDRFTASSSSDGSSYALVAGSAVTVVLPTAVSAGLAADSGVSSTAGASILDSLVVGTPGTPPGPPAPPSPCPSGWSCSDVGNPASVGDQSLAAGTWTIKGAGAASGNNAYADQFHLVWQSIPGDATLSARLASQANTSASAQAGLVFRTDATNPGAVSFGAFITPTSGIQVVYRTSSGLRTILAATATGAAPAYLQITRYGNTYTAFTSPDGVAWSAIIGSSVTLGAGGAMVAGMAVNSNGTSLATNTFDTVSLANAAAPPPSVCPTGWTCQDIGFPQPAAGSQYVVAPSWTVEAGGGDIWGVYDSFRLLSQPMAADGTMSARVDSQANTNAWAKAGVMIRATNDPGAPYFAALITPGNGIAVQWRGTQGGSSSQVSVAGAVPAWIEVSRAGSTFTAYTSADGVTWTAVPGTSVSLVMPGTLLAGLAVTSHNGGQMGAATFDTPTLTNGSATPPGACPTSWTCADIGNVGTVGGQSLTSGTWIVQGGGGDIWDVADSFHFAFQSLASDGSFSTRAVSQSNTSVWAKAGVMMRATIDPGSPYYAVFVTPGSGVAVQWRSVQAATSSQVLALGAPVVYLRVARSGGVYSSYTSSDGATWTLLPGSTVNLGLTGAVLAGLAVTSHAWGVLGSATFDSVAVVPLPAPWTDADIGAPALVGSATYAAGVFTVNGAGADIYGTADQLNFVSQGLTGNGTLTARIASQANANAWAKAGLMLRATSDPGAMNYAVFATPANGVVVQWRTAQAGTTGQVKIAGTVPLYLRVVRSANTFTAYTSPDGVAWTAVAGSSLTIAMPSSILAGMAVTSHTAAALGSATFDGVALSTSTPNDFSIAASPASPSIAQGASGGTSITTTLISGSAEAVVLAVSGLPAGVTATLTPTSVTAGGSATLGLVVASSVPTGTYPLTVTGTAPSATHAAGVNLTVVAPPPPLPAPWTDADIGAPALVGSATYAAGVFTVNGAGADIYGTADQLNFVSQGLTGNGTLTARIASQASTNPSAKAGLMFRATSSPGSPYFAVLMTATKGVVVQWRTAQGGTTSQTSKVAGVPPLYLRVVRSANIFTAYTSADGVTWTLVPGSSQTIALPTALLAGMAVTSHNTGALCAATFDGVSVVPGP